jgi:hypothetical protein
LVVTQDPLQAMLLPGHHPEDVSFDTFRLQVIALLEGGLLDNHCHDLKDSLDVTNHKQGSDAVVSTQMRFLFATNRGTLVEFAPKGIVTSDSASLFRSLPRYSLCPLRCLPRYHHYLGSWPKRRARQSGVDF